MNEFNRHYMQPDALDLLIRDIETTLFWERKAKMIDRDRYLQDYHLPWRGATDNWSVPENQYREYLALAKQEEKASVSMTGHGFNILQDQFGNVVIQAGGRQHIELTPAQWVEFMRLANAMPSGAPGGPTPSGQSSAPVGDQAMKAHEFTPELKRNHEEAMAELEKFAKTSSQWPKHT